MAVFEKLDGLPPSWGVNVSLSASQQKPGYVRTYSLPSFLLLLLLHPTVLFGNRALIVGRQRRSQTVAGGGGAVTPSISNPFGKPLLCPEYSDDEGRRGE